MEFTEELRLSILSLWHEAHDKDMDSFCKLLKEKAEKLGISYNVLLQLVFNKEYLFFEVLPKVEEIDKKVNDVATKLGIKDVLQKYPYQMSGGQKQRVASARAIVTDPQIVLADEPTGALDSRSSRMLLESFDYLNEKLNTTILMVTHDSFCASYASRVIFIKDGKVFNEIIKGNSSRKEFFDKIIDVVTLLGGEENDNY